MTLTAPATDVRAHLDVLRELRPDLAPCLDVLAGDSLRLIETGPHRRLLDRLLDALVVAPATPDHAWRAAVAVNMFGIVARGAAADYRNVAVLAGFGQQSVAAVQDEFDSMLGSRPDRPFATAVIVKLARNRDIQRVLLDAGHHRADAEAVAGECRKAAFWLLMAGVDSTTPGPLPRSPLDLRLIVETQGVTAWRRLLANVAANPWGPAAKNLADLARAAGLAIPAQVVEECVRIYRQRAEDAERLEVAQDIRRIVAASGFSQRQFAKYIGTSAPRLSTYVNGVVTPSASMLLRMRKVAATLAQPVP